jgi:hypothetical protein
MAGGEESLRASSIMNWMLARSESTCRPRRPSLAPVSMTSTETGWRRSQSIRRRAPAEVSPLTPAFTASNASPAESILRWITAG